MTEELKTLKDFDINVANGNCHEEDWFIATDKDKLKQEAIKYYKKLIQNRFEIQPMLPFDDKNGHILTTEFIKHFFNLTEDELK